MLIRETQIFFRLKLLDKHFDLLINFNAPLIKEGIKKKLYYNLCVFACPVAPEDGAGVSLWLNYYKKSKILVFWLQDPSSSDSITVCLKKK